jgi:DNA-directed RNA polymerase subunit A"
MTLRTFHYAGVAELNVTLGLPRIIEIIDARRVPSTALMTIYLTGKYAEDKNKARAFAQEIEATTVEDVASQTEMDLINMEFVVTLDRSRMQQKGLTPTKVASTIHEALKIEAPVEGNKLRIKPPTQTLSELRRTATKVKGVPLRGIKGINRVVVKMEGNEYVVYTEGSNLADILQLRGVDQTRTVTNNINEIEEVLGIEAARNSIISEAVKTLEEQGLDVDVRHIMLVADMMTHDGDMKQVGRHGVSGEKASVLARASFEVTTKHLLDACIRGEKDKLDGIIENVIAGQPIPLGTGLVELVMRREGKVGHQ